MAPNATYGVSLESASNNIIGEPGEGNLIGGNKSNGIFATLFSNGNLIQANDIGSLPIRNSEIGLSPPDLANGGDGINLTLASSNTLGGTSSGGGGRESDLGQ